MVISHSMVGTSEELMENWEVPTTKSSNGIHSPVFGEIMLEACKEQGVECHLQYWEKDRPKPAISRQQFLDRLLLKTVANVIH